MILCAVLIGMVVAYFPLTLFFKYADRPWLCLCRWGFYSLALLALGMART